MKVWYFIGLCVAFTIILCGWYFGSLNKLTGQDDIIDEALVDNILVRKARRQMLLRQGEEVVRAYNISLGRNPVGAKMKEGDNKTPEGKYYIVSHNPNSAYHLSLKISYPTESQRQIAHKNGYSAGGDIMVHGFPNKAPNFLFAAVHRMRDWTAGCIAVTNSEIEQIYRLVKDGTPIVIEP